MIEQDLIISFVPAFADVANGFNWQIGRGINITFISIPDLIKSICNTRGFCLNFNMICPFVKDKIAVNVYKSFTPVNKAVMDQIGKIFAGYVWRFGLLFVRRRYSLSKDQYNQYDAKSLHPPFFEYKTKSVPKCF